MFFDAVVFLLKKQRMAIQHHLMNDENNEAQVYKLVLVFQVKEN